MGYFHVRNFTVIEGRFPGLYGDKVSCSSITQPLEILVSSGHSTKRATELSNIFSFSFYELQELHSLTRTFAARKHKYMYLKKMTSTPLDRELFLDLFDGGCSHISIWHNGCLMNIYLLQRTFRIANLTLWSKVKVKCI